MKYIILAVIILVLYVIFISFLYIRMKINDYQDEKKKNDLTNNQTLEQVNKTIEGLKFDIREIRRENIRLKEEIENKRRIRVPIDEFLNKYLKSTNFNTQLLREMNRLSLNGEKYFWISQEELNKLEEGNNMSDINPENLMFNNSSN